MREAVAAAEGRTGRAEDEVQAQQTALALTVEQLQRRSAEVDELNEANRASHRRLPIFSSALFS